MSKYSFSISSCLILGMASVFLLSACGRSLEAPEAVIKKAQEAMTEITSGKIKVSADAEGQNVTDDILFKGTMNLIFDNKNEEERKADLHLMLSGNMKAAENVLNGEFDVNFITLDNKYYVKLNKLTSNNASLTSMQPFIDLYIGKWLQIAEDFIPENIRNVQSQDKAMELRNKQLKDLFAETDLFDVIKEYGIEKVNGKKAYHYGLKPNMEGFKDYMLKAAAIDGRELTIQEIQEAITILTYIKHAEIYIDANDYYVLKSNLIFSSEALSGESNSNLDIKIFIEGSDYNKSVTVKAPKDAEDFNPLSLIMGLGSMGVLQEDAVLTGDDVSLGDDLEDEAEAETETVEVTNVEVSAEETE